MQGRSSTHSTRWLEFASKRACSRARRLWALEPHSYLDITGEVGVFEASMRLDKLAKEKRVLVMPGIGFDVVPSDCAACCRVERGAC